MLARHARLDERAGRRCCARPAERGLLSARGEHRVLRVARTIADLEAQRARAHVPPRRRARAAPGRRPCGQPRGMSGQDERARASTALPRTARGAAGCCRELGGPLEYCARDRARLLDAAGARRPRAAEGARGQTHGGAARALRGLPRERAGGRARRGAICRHRAGYPQALGAACGAAYARGARGRRGGSPSSPRRRSVAILGSRAAERLRLGDAPGASRADSPPAA